MYYMHYYLELFPSPVPGAVEFYGNLSVAFFSIAEFEFGARRGNLQGQIEDEIK